MAYHVLFLDHLQLLAKHRPEINQPMLFWPWKPEPDNNDPVHPIGVLAPQITRRDSQLQLSYM